MLEIKTHIGRMNRHNKCKVQIFKYCVIRTYLNIESAFAWLSLNNALASTLPPDARTWSADSKIVQDTGDKNSTIMYLRAAIYLK